MKLSLIGLLLLSPLRSSDGMTVSEAWVDFVAYFESLVKSDPEELFRAALHEAGHVVVMEYQMTYMEAAGVRLEKQDGLWRGLTQFRSRARSQEGEPSFEELRLREATVLVAGRITEELIEKYYRSGRLVWSERPSLDFDMVSYGLAKHGFNEQEIRDILIRAKDRARRILVRRFSLLLQVAHRLIQYKVINRHQLDMLFRGVKQPDFRRPFRMAEQQESLDQCRRIIREIGPDLKSE